jgi:hypothetical protein
MMLLVSQQSVRNAVFSCVLHAPLVVRIVSTRDAQANVAEPALPKGLDDLGFAMV